MQRAAKFWNKVAAKYAKSSIENIEAYNYTMGRTRTYLASTDSVLEVGCGTGSTALLLAGDVEQIVASDISEKMIEIATDKARDQSVSNVRFMVTEQFGDKEECGPYDVVLALNLLHLLEDLPGALRSINGLLKPGGTFISKTVCKPGKGASLKFRMIKTILPIMQFIGKAPYVNFMEIKELEEAIQAHGFKIIEVGDHPPPSRYIVAKKA